MDMNIAAWILAFAAASPQEDWDYAGPMKKAAARFSGHEGVVIHVGGSMTIANPYTTWPRSGKGKTAEDQAILAWMHLDKKDKTDGWWLCRTEVEHYRAYTSESGLKSAMLFAGGARGLPTLEKMLEEYKPRMVTIECGIYDVEDGVPLDDYRKNMARALDLILDRGAIPIPNTIPPFKAQMERTRQFNVALRALAKERGVPVIDLEREILTRRPDDWFGTLVDRIHLTAGKAGGAEPTEENLRRSGYLLRGWLTVKKIAEVKQRVIDAAEPEKKNSWIKRSPTKDGPPSPGLSYETSLAYDPVARRVIRWGGHAQGGVKGSGEQIAELWTLDPSSMTWELKEPNRSPPASCCVQQNVFDTAQNRFLRFKAAGGNHGWQWYREIYLNNTSLWNYDLAANVWRDLRPLPEPPISLLHCASWDVDRQVAVVFGGEGTQEGTLVYDPYVNTWTWMGAKNEPGQGSKEARSGGNMAYDAARRLHVLFGAQFTDDPHTWGYDLSKNEWRDLKPATMPPTDRNDAVLAYDSVNRVIVAVVRVADALEGKEAAKAHLETWCYDAGRNSWERLKVEREPDPIGARSRVLTFVPDQNSFLIDGYVKPTERVAGVEREHQIWTYRYAEAAPDKAPRAPTGVLVVTTADSATLRWQAGPSPDLTEYVVFRGEGAQPWLVDYKPVARVPKTATSWRDAGLNPGSVYFYCVRAVGEGGRESADSVKVRTQPRVVEDVVVSVLSAKDVRLTWAPPADHSDIAGYHVERAVAEVFSEDEVVRLKKDTPPLADPSVGAIKDIGPFRRLTREPVKTTSYADLSVDLTRRETVDGEPLKRSTRRFRGDQLDPAGKPYRNGVYAYRIRAVNLLGVESGPSPYFLTIPSAPQHLFSRERGGEAQLKWAANPEIGLKGYRVYWMKGPRPEGAGQATHRLTADPIAETRAVDAQAGTEPRRYWVVAVDALGQEGIPSSPAWHYRTQRSFYVPFVGEWHQ
jgi:hypothetical protein